MALPPRLLLPDAPALIAGHGRATLLTPDGELLESRPPSCAGRWAAHRRCSVHGPATARRLDLPRFDACFDLLELFAFCLRPGRRRRRRAAWPWRSTSTRRPMTAAAAALLPEMADHPAAPPGRRPRPADEPRCRRSWRRSWRRPPPGPGRTSVLAALGAGEEKPSLDPYKVWRRLPDWEDPGPAQPPGSSTSPRPRPAPGWRRCSGEGAEPRPTQADYASAAAAAFAPRERPGPAPVVLAEAGTGVGKTLGYVAPASLWAEKQRRAGLDRDLHPQPAAPDRQRARPAAPRLGREARAGW